MESDGNASTWPNCCYCNASLSDSCFPLLLLLLLWLLLLLLLLPLLQRYNNKKLDAAAFPPLTRHVDKLIENCTEWH